MCRNNIGFMPWSGRMMKTFKISFNFKADDDWKTQDAEEMLNTVLDPIYHLGDSFVGNLCIDEVEEAKDEF